MTKIEALRQAGAKFTDETGQGIIVNMSTVLQAMDLYAETWIADIESKRDTANLREIQSIRALTERFQEWQEIVLQRITHKASDGVFTIYDKDAVYEKGWYVVMVYNDTVPALVLHDPVSPNAQGSYLAWYTGGFTYRKLPMKNGMRIMFIPVQAGKRTDDSP